MCCLEGDRVTTVGISNQSSRQGLDGGATRRFGDEREDVVTTVLNKEEGGERCTPVRLERVIPVGRGLGDGKA